jgi:NADH-quinone oxidoreductase subunit I
VTEFKRHPFVQYFVDLWTGIFTTYKGMRLTLTYFFKPKVTMFYPEERPTIYAGHRGIHRYVEEECLLCRACEAACPVDCLVIKALGRGKDRMILNFEIDYSKCLFCNLCCEACNPKCIYMGETFDLSATERSGCLVDFARKKTAEEIEAHQKMLEQKEAEKKAAAAKKETEKACGEEDDGTA